MAIAAASIGSGRTFKQAAIEFLDLHRGAWRDGGRQAEQWEATLTDYIYPVIGDLSVDTITTAHVAAVLTPIWTAKQETASRVRGRIEQILGREKALKHRTGENPARWKENLDAVFPRRPPKAKSVQHHAAMPAKSIGDFMVMLRADDSVAARALEFTILTAARSGEVQGALWNEIDFDERLWIVPASRMKSGREHRVPLAPRAIEILRQMQAKRSGEFVFPGQRPGTKLAATSLREKMQRLGITGLTVHGFRSTFRDWCGESTNFPSEVAELALAHFVGDETERSYRRGDQLAKRFALAEAWAEFCTRPSIKGAGKVVGIRAHERE
jgi:integrase